MSQAARIKRNSFFVFLSHIIRLLSNVVIFIAIARSYGPTEFGQFTAAHTLSAVFLPLADFGFDLLLSSEIARQRHKASELLQRYLSLKILFAVVATVVMVAAAFLQNVSESTRELMWIFSFYVLLTALTNFFIAFFRGMEEMHHESKISFFMNGFLLLAVWMLIVIESSVVMIAVAFIASRILGLVLAGVAANRFVQPREFRFVWPRKSDFLTIGIFGSTAVFGNLFSSQDTLLISWWRGDHDVGIYQSVFRIFAFSLIVSDILSITLLPVLSRLYEQQREVWVNLSRLLHKTLLFVVLPISLIPIVLPAELIGVLYGLESYKEAVPLMRVFGIVLLVRYSVETGALVLTSTRRQHVRLFIVGLGVVVNFLLNSYAIPSYGVMGAALVALATNLFVGIGYWTMARHNAAGWVFNLQCLLPAGTAITLGIALSFADPTLTYFMLPIALVIIVATAYFLGYTKVERSLLFSMTRYADFSGKAQGSGHLPW